MIRCPALLAAAAIACAAAPLAAQPLTTSFTYQGELRQSGSPAAGNYDLRFRLYDAFTGGTQLGPQLCFDNTLLTAGRFTLSLDFGTQFSGQQRFLEIDARPDTGLDCTNPAGFTPLSPRQPLSASPYSLFSAAPWQTDAATGRLSYSASNVGIGTASPLRPLQVVNANTFTARFENSNVSTAVFELRNSASNATWELDVGGTTPPFALPAGSFYIFKALGNPTPGLSIDPAGNVAISKLTATSTIVGSVAVFANGNTASTTGVYGRGASYGVFAAGIGNYGLFGSATGYGVYADGDLGSNGVKSFRIDHPADPENKFLLHYCAESPEVINFYRGSVALDAGGAAVVVLPAYFSRINTSPTYQLTAVGAPMPMLHIAAEIDPAALAAGAAAPPGQPAPLCSFTIAGGAPRGQVSWRVEAQRNDRWVRQHGAPVEADKPPSERGLYERPELYNQPVQKRAHPDPKE